MEPEEKKISVWICQEEKLISGLSKRTTCADVVRVLLEDSRQQQQRRRWQQIRRPGGGGGGGGQHQEWMLSGTPQCYCIVEKWRGFERILPNKTRILRLWAAWGDEQENVRFVLVRSEASLPNAGPRSAEARVVPSKDPGTGTGTGAGPTITSTALALSQERQRRVVRKAFRKLAKLNKRRGSQPPLHDPPVKEASGVSERMETLVHLVLSQDHTIRQQLKRLRDLDREIDRYEARVHLDRVRRHGANYVQDTYLVGGEQDPPGEEEEEGQEEEEGELEEYTRRCQQVARLQEQRLHQEELLEQLAGEIQEELNQRWMERRRQDLASDCDTTELGGGGGGGEGNVEQDRVQTQLSTSAYIGLRLSTDLKAVRKDLERTQLAFTHKERELQHLQDTLRALDLQQQEGQEEEGQQEEPQTLQLLHPTPVPTQEEWGEPDKDCQDNDEDSDTGLSSMHSQDSDSVPVCESLV